VTLRKFAGVVPVIAALALAAPVASASAQTTAPGAGSSIACYPYPALCGPSGQPWLPSPFLSLLPMSPFTAPPAPHFGPGPVQLPGTGFTGFGPGPVQIP
jgi:hypothetical protein